MKIYQYGFKLVCIFLILFSTPLLATSATRIIYLEQNWSQQERQRFYNLAQGSYLIPLKWFQSLEQFNSQLAFNSQHNIKHFNYLLNEYQVGGLPLGFAVETVRNGQDWMGYTCAACHTNDIIFNGHRLRIDGAPTLADFGQFITQLALSVHETTKDLNKFKRFAFQVTLSNDPICIKNFLMNYNSLIYIFLGLLSVIWNCIIMVMLV